MTADSSTPPQFPPVPREPAPENPHNAMSVDDQRAFFARRRVRLINIPPKFKDATVANWTTLGDPKLEKIKVNALSFVASFQTKTPQSGLVLSGCFGCGKTRLACSILHDLALKGVDGLYQNVPELLHEIRATYNQPSTYDNDEETEDSILAECESVTLLCLDDVGAEKPSEWVLDRLYLIINSRYQRGLPTIYTTNINRRDLAQRISERIASRIDESSTTIGEFPNRDMRRSKSKSEW